ncbi:MAG TPA: 6-phosphogluconolactonase, partial [Gemmatimonadales bacterium]|nr:6-phosphogluconolactonase [Gemmatimonadales bacterium]
RERVRWVVAEYVDSVRMWRITLTPVVINAARSVTFVVSGAGKADRVRDVIEGPRAPQRWPAQVIAPVAGRLIWLVDEAAAAALRRRPLRL